MAKDKKWRIFPSWTQERVRREMYWVSREFDNLQHYSPHTIRHTYATELAKMGANVTTIANPDGAQQHQDDAEVYRHEPNGDAAGSTDVQSNQTIVTLEVAHDTNQVHTTMKENKEQEQKERQRKEYAKEGRSQKMMSFRLDNDNAEWLEQFPNKGRYLNNLIKAERERGAK